MSKTIQIGGDIVTDMKHLAIPFSLLLALNGVDYIKKQQKKKALAPPKPSKKKQAPRQSGGACGACNGAKMVGGTAVNNELHKLAMDIKSILSQYKA